MKFLIWLMTMTLTACTPTLAPQPVHTVNPVPAPILTKHHTDELPNAQKLDVQQIVGKWTLQKVLIVSQENKAELLKNLDNKTRLTLIQKDGGQLAMSASIGCNTMSAVRQLDGQGNLSNAKNAMMTSTLKSCGELSDRTESRFGAFLWETKRIGIVGDVLSLTDKYGNVLTFTQNQVGETFEVKAIFGKWVFQNAKIINNQHNADLLSQLTQHTYVIFSAHHEGKTLIQGSIGCNGMGFAPFIDTNGNIIKSNKLNDPDNYVISNLVGCGDKIDRIERRFKYFLGDSAKVWFLDGVLSLTDKYGNVLTFVRQN